MQQPTDLDPDQGFVCLRQDLLRPGDVLLVRNSGLEATGISLAHPSRFTHAAIFVDRARLFEADGEGVGTARPVILQSAHDDGAVVLLPDSKDAAVLRHPGLTHVEPGSVSEADLALMLDAIVSRKVQPYSRLGRLSKAAGPLEGIASVVLEAMDFHEALHQHRGSARRKHDEGRFCSEIVCEVLSELGYPAFVDGRCASDVGPGHLTESVLTDVTARVVIRRGAAHLGDTPEHLTAVIDEYYANRATLMLHVEQELNARREDERARIVLEGEALERSRVDAVRARVDLCRQVLDEVQVNYKQHRLDRHALAAERIRATLSGLKTGDAGTRARLRQAARDVTRLAAEYELLRIRAAANALGRVGDAVGSERLMRRAGAIEAWVGLDGQAGEVKPPTA
jgi:hypothetical protein